MFDKIVIAALGMLVSGAVLAVNGHFIDPENIDRSVMFNGDVAAVFENDIPVKRCKLGMVNDGIDDYKTPYRIEGYKCDKHDGFAVKITHNKPTPTVMIVYMTDGKPVSADSYGEVESGTWVKYDHRVFP